MKINPKSIEENELDQLLRQFVLDGGSDEFTQNTMTMNADMIFNNTPQIAPDAAREMALIQKLENAFIKRRGFGKFWLNGIIFLFIISAAVWIYKVNSGNKIVASQNNGNKENTFAPAVSDDTSTTIQNPELPANSLKTSFVMVADSTVTDTAHNVTVPPKKERFITPDSHMDVGLDWYSGNYIMEDVPGPMFNAVPSPDNYKKLQGEFQVDTFTYIMNMMFSPKQRLITSTYYTGEPFKKGFSDMLYINYGQYAAGKDWNEWKLPGAMVYYSDTSVDAKVVKTDLNWDKQPKFAAGIELKKLPEKAIQLTLQPFYFRKYEVTNKEYREFVNWVRTSNGYAHKAIMAAFIDTVEVADPKDKSGEQITIKDKKYKIVRKTTPTEDFKEVFNYIFFNANSVAVKSLGRNSVYVFPDTVSWITDFSFSYNEPMTNMYFWHPAYDNYPVVGVSWYQAMAFLDWKTHMHQKQLDENHIPYEIEYTLPSEIEWEMASTLEMHDKQMLFNPKYESSYHWITDLAVSYSVGKDAEYEQYKRTGYLKNMFTKDQYFKGDFISDGYFHTGPADLSQNKNAKASEFSHVDQFGISWMDGNVSEWMMESYAENWKPFFVRHLAVLDLYNDESVALAKQIEMLYDKGNAKNGRLVRGGNWYDERFGSKPGSGRNEAGMSPKRFVDPSEQHSTIGFRYVVHVKRK